MNERIFMGGMQGEASDFDPKPGSERLFFR